MEQVSYTNPDLDNNYATPGSSGVQFIDDLFTRKYFANPPEISLEIEETQELGGEEIHYNFTYDDYGNCITKSDGINTWEYAYDYENRLLSIKENGQVIEQYIYNGDGQRIKKINADSARIYIYSGINILYEINMATQMDGIYIYGPTGRIAKRVNDITEFYHTDHLGSTRLTTSETGAPVTEVQYRPFGEQINTTDERYTYNGKELDDSGLYYYGARYYDPEIGRFISRDFLQGKRESPQTLSRYAYCLNNPLRYVDPAGTETQPPSDPQQIVEHLYAYLQNITPEQFAEIQEMLDMGNEFGALLKILDLMGIEYEITGQETLSVKIGDKSQPMKIDNNMSEWGLVDPSTGTISINFSSGKAGDVILTILHEACHVVLGECRTLGEMDVQHDYIYGVEYSFMVALSGLGVEFSHGDTRKGEKSFVQHITCQVSVHGGTAHQIPLTTVVRMLKLWWSRC